MGLPLRAARDAGQQELSELELTERGHTQFGKEPGGRAPGLLGVLGTLVSRGEGASAGEDPF
jgi:hypothetical protein